MECPDPSRALKPLAALAAGLFVFGVLGAELAHNSEMRRLADLMDRNDGRAGSYVAKTWGPRTAACVHGGRPDELVSLARALLAVETAAVSPTEYEIERALALVNAALDLSPPRLSIGPGQIKPEAAGKVLEMAHRDKAELFQEDNKRLVSTLLGACGSLAAAAKILDKVIIVKRDPGGYIARSEVMRAAAEWNGQRRGGPLEKRLAHARYREAVYETFQVFRFGGAPPV